MQTTTKATMTDALRVMMFGAESHGYQLKAARPYGDNPMVGVGSTEELIKMLGRRPIARVRIQAADGDSVEIRLVMSHQHGISASFEHENKACPVGEHIQLLVAEFQRQANLRGVPAERVVASMRARRLDPAAAARRYQEAQEGVSVAA